MTDLLPKARASSGPTCGAQMTLSVYNLSAPTLSFAINFSLPWVQDIGSDCGSRDLKEEVWLDARGTSEVMVVFPTWSLSLPAVAPDLEYLVSLQLLIQPRILFLRQEVQCPASLLT